MSAGSFARFSSFQRTAGRSLAPGRPSRVQSGSPFFTETRNFLCSLRHLADDILDEIFARLQKVIEADRLSAMPSKPRLNSAEISSRCGARTSAIGRLWLSK